MVCSVGIQQWIRLNHVDISHGMFDKKQNHMINLNNADNSHANIILNIRFPGSQGEIKVLEHINPYMH